MIQKAKNWLSEDVCPLWLSEGFDSKNNFFQENLSMEGKALPDTPRRVMVQARQIFSFMMAADLGACDKNKVKDVVAKTAQAILTHYSLPSGGFIHSVDASGKPIDTKTDLYAQAFALFGLAHAYGLEPKQEYKTRALALVNYLNRERKAPGGGYSEINAQGISYESNPHMHLFEAAIAWMEISPDPAWTKLATEILDLALAKFIDPTTGLLAEYFDAGWKIRMENGRFIFEPGHQYEWSWLMGRYQKITGRDLTQVRWSLFFPSEKHGLDSKSMMAFDEMWSDLTPKTTTSRFWPQSERVKTALQLASQSSGAQREVFLQAADDAMTALFAFLETPRKGLWYDRLTSTGFTQGPAKASSLYHIVGAVYDYVRMRASLGASN
jgi:mannose-6-phosphate isomerase